MRASLVARSNSIVIIDYAGRTDIWTKAEMR